MPSKSHVRWPCAALAGAAFVTIAAASPARADAVPEVQRFLKEEITKQQTVPGPLDLHEPTLAAPYGGYALSLFRLQIRADFGFDVGVGKLTVYPVAEFFWE